MLKIPEIESKLKELSELDKKFLVGVGTNGVLRKFMIPTEIKTANRLYKLGYLEKGHTPDKYASVFFYVDTTINSKNKIHKPKHQYDCFNCKFHWCCGPNCWCGLKELSQPTPEQMIKYMRKYKLNQIQHAQ